MANFHQIYFYTFKDLTESEYRVEFWKDLPSGDTPPAEIEIRGDAKPATINYPEVKTYTPIRPSGADLNLLSTDDRMFFGLYTPDMMEYQIRIYKDKDLYWLGFLDSENYSEPFDAIDNYPVNITGNDGFNLLERLDYVEVSLNYPTNYEGIESFWTVIQRVLQKLNLPWEYIYIGLSIAPPKKIYPTGTHVLQDLFLNNDNWYDEDATPENCRTVLENILQILGAFIIQQNGSLIITDTHHLTTQDFLGNVNFQRWIYGYESTSYDQDVNLRIGQGDISDIGVESNQITFNVESGINKQLVTYSPYNITDYFNYDADGDFSKENGRNIFEVNPKVIEFYYAKSKIWDKFGTALFGKVRGANYANRSINEYYLRILPIPVGESFGDSNHLSFKLKKALPLLNPSYNYRIKLKMEIMVQTEKNYVKKETYNTDINYILCRLNVKIKSGNKFLSNVHPSFGYPSDRAWTTTDSFCELQFNNINEDGDRETINQTVLQLQDYRTDPDAYFGDWYIPMEDLESKKLEIEIWDYQLRNKAFQMIGAERFSKLEIRKIELVVVDENDVAVTSKDIEYTSRIDRRFKNEGDAVICYLGHNPDQCPVQRGNILSRSPNPNIFKYFKTLEKNGKADRPEHLLLRSIKSNYGTQNAKLNVILPLANPLSNYTYTNYLTGKNLHTVAIKQDLWNGFSSVVLKELHPDDATIIIEEPEEEEE